VSKVKENRRNTAAAVERILPATPWPDDFAPARTALFMAGCCGALGIMMLAAALLGAMVPVKIALASLLGMYNPAMVSDSSFDLATIVFGLGTIVFGGIIHPSVGIAVLVLFRPWIDGYTFPTDNLYFVSGVFVLTALWAVRVALRGGRIRGLAFAAPLALFLAVALAGLSRAWEINTTSRQLLLWFSYLMLFLLTLNSATSRMSVGIMLGGLCATMGLEALFAILHYEFLLPFLREIVKKPGVLQQFFNTDTLTPELARRFSINRAFGSVLFPNSLAAYLLLGTPVVAAGALLAWRRLRETAADDRPSSARASSFAALGVWLVSLVLLMFIMHFPAVYRDDENGTPWYFQLGTMFAAAALLGLAPAAWTHRLSIRRGLAQCGRTLAAWGLTIALVLAAWALIITYSRGAWLALLAAVVWAGILLRGRSLIRTSLRRLFPALAALALVAGTVWGWSQAASSGVAWAQQAKPAAAAAATTADEGPRSTRVTQQGKAVSTKDLMDPASFRIRLTYWRVALSMAAHNLVTGVGLGNFGIAYAHYQYLGAGDVREAHSGYLQALCETGVPGALLFLLFWVFAAAGGALNALRVPDSRTRLWLLALHTGLVAFCLHAAIDINFSHPSLVMTAMVLAGLGVGWRATSDAEDNQDASGPLRHRVLACGLLVLIGLACGVASRICLQELTLSRLTFANTSNDQEIFRRYRAARFFVDDLGKYCEARGQGHPPGKLPQFLLREALNLNPDPARWARTADFFVPDKNSAHGYRKLAPGEPLSMDAVMMVRRPRLAQAAAIAGIEGWLVEMENIDSRFPCNPEMAVHIARLYELLALANLPLQLVQYRSLWFTGYYDWGRTALARSPHSAEMENFYAHVLSSQAVDSSSCAPIPYMESAATHAQKAVEYSPLLPPYRTFLAERLEKLAEFYGETGDTAKVEALKAQAAEVRKEADKLQNERWHLGIDY